MSKLESYVTYEKGFAFKAKNYAKQGMPIIRVSDFTSDSISLESINFLDKNALETVKSVELKTDDIVIATVGSWATNPNSIVGKVIRVPKKANGSLLNQNAVRLRCCNADEQIFLYYALKNKDFSNYILSTAQGSANQASITLKAILNYNLPKIQKEHKLKIGSILDSLDKKIQLNTETNQTLETIAQALFKSWFIDFDPVRAKAEALANGKTEAQATIEAMKIISGKTSDQLTQLAQDNPKDYQQLQTTAEAFPNGFDDTGIPLGWEVGKLSDIATFPTDRIATEKVGLENYISTDNMLENKGGIQSAGKLPSSKTVPKFDKNHILISNIRPYFKKIWLANFSGGRSPDVLGFVSKNNKHTEFLYNLLYQDSFFEFMMTTSKGAKMPRGDKDAIMNMEIILPNDDLMSKYSKTVRTFYETIVSLKQQNDNLAETRNILLPRLLSECEL